ncbi:unnamed protein product, partial [Musa hybrid cultivar]
SFHPFLPSDRDFLHPISVALTAATLPPTTGGRELSVPPSDGISNHSDLLLVSSWDKSLRLYDAGANVLEGEFVHAGPVLDCCFHDDSAGFSACADHTVRSYGTFATGGCDGYVNLWDGNNKKRLYQYSKYPTSIAALSFSRDGHLLAVASSYTFEEADTLHEPDAIFVWNVNEVEVKPKPKA